MTEPDWLDAAMRERRLGSVWIDDALLEGRETGPGRLPPPLDAVIATINAHRDPIRNTWLFTGYCAGFDPLGPDEPAPRYGCYIHTDSGVVTRFQWLRLDHGPAE